jgi:hypothetical protein
LFQNPVGFEHAPEKPGFSVNTEAVPKAEVLEQPLLYNRKPLQAMRTVQGQS